MISLVSILLGEVEDNLDSTAGVTKNYTLAKTGKILLVRSPIKSNGHLVRSHRKAWKEKHIEHRGKGGQISLTTQGIVSLAAK